MQARVRLRQILAQQLDGLAQLFVLPGKLFGRRCELGESLLQRKGRRRRPVHDGCFGQDVAIN